MPTQSKSTDSKESRTKGNANRENLQTIIGVKSDYSHVWETAEYENRTLGGVRGARRSKFILTCAIYSIRFRFPFP